MKKPLEKTEIQIQTIKEENNGFDVFPTVQRSQGGGSIGWWEGAEGELRLDTLRKAWLLFGASDEEACYLAGINKPQLYYYCQKNPAFQEEKEQLKLNPVLVAIKTVRKALETNVDVAMKYLEKKKPSEWGNTKIADPNSPMFNFGTINQNFDNDFLTIEKKDEDILVRNELTGQFEKKQ